MTRDTDIGGADGCFPHTRLTALQALRAADPQLRRRALDVLVGCYWKPVYKLIRYKWQAASEEAKDLTQGFFAHALEKAVFDRYEPGRAAFRTFLRACLDAYIINERKAASRQKRGGDVLTFSLDFADAEGEYRRCEPAVTADPDEVFEREWTRSLFSLAVQRLRETLESSGRSVQFQVFERYDLREPAAGEKPTYEDLAREFGLPATQVTNYLAAARREFRRIVLATLRDITGSEEEFREEAARLL